MSKIKIKIGCLAEYGFWASISDANKHGYLCKDGEIHGMCYQNDGYFNTEVECLEAINEYLNKDRKDSFKIHFDGYFYVSKYSEGNLVGHVNWDGTVCSKGTLPEHYSTLEEAEKAIDRHGRLKPLDGAEPSLKRSRYEDYLSLLCGLHVTFKSTNKGGMYEFFTDSSGSTPLKTTYQYKKAKMFAEGVAMGRKLENQQGK